VYRRDGKPYPESAAGVESIRMVTVTAVDPRTEDVYVIVNGKPSEKPSTITISADGMTMTQGVSGRDAKGKAVTNTVVYDRQPWGGQRGTSSKRVPFRADHRAGGYNSAFMRDGRAVPFSRLSKGVMLRQLLLVGATVLCAAAVAPAQWVTIKLPN